MRPRDRLAERLAYPSFAEISQLIHVCSPVVCADQPEGVTRRDHPLLVGIEACSRKHLRNTR